MDIKTGDEIHVFIRGYRTDNDYPAIVTKVGRKYGTAEYDNPRYGMGIGSRAPEKLSIEFDLATGRERNERQYGAGGSYVCTLEEFAVRQRKSAAQATIVRAGVTVNGSWGRFTVEQLEALAAVTAGFPEYDNSR